jgi:CRISPR system Cascade subunit CasB
MSEAEESQITLRSLVGRIAAHIGEVMPPGDVASLRKLRPGAMWSPPFWRILVLHLSRSLPAEGRPRLDTERKWAAIVQAIAQLRGLHDPQVSLGRALARAGATEQRFLRLLRATDEPLADAVSTAAHQLATGAQAVDCADFARLVLSDGRADEQSIRERIAYDYYAEVERTQKEEAR